MWASLGRADYLEAFAAHPRIGDAAALRKVFGKYTYVYIYIDCCCLSIFFLRGGQEVVCFAIQS